MATWRNSERPWCWRTGCEVLPPRRYVLRRLTIPAIRIGGVCLPSRKLQPWRVFHCVGAVEKTLTHYHRSTRGNDCRYTFRILTTLQPVDAKGRKAQRLRATLCFSCLPLARPGDFGLGASQRADGILHRGRLNESAKREVLIQLRPGETGSPGDQFPFRQLWSARTSKPNVIGNV